MVICQISVLLINSKGSNRQAVVMCSLTDGFLDDFGSVNMSLPLYLNICRYGDMCGHVCVTTVCGDNRDLVSLVQSVGFHQLYIYL